jgi:hypothetical protein
VCCAPVRACGGCVRGACVGLCGCGGVCACMLVCLCVVCVAGWCVGVRARLDCDGLGLVAVAWTRVCMYVCVSWLLCLFVREFSFVWVVVLCVLRWCVGRCRRRWLVWMHVYCVG